MAKAVLVTIPSTSVDVDGFVGEKRVIEIGDRRTIFFSFKSDDISEKDLSRLQAHLSKELGASGDTKVIVLAIGSTDSFAIHELTT